MHKLLRLAAMQWSETLQYRADLLLWTAAEAVVPLVSLAIWLAVADSAKGALTVQDTTTYFVLMMFVVVIASAWNGFFLAREIRDGLIVQYLTRPLSIFWKHAMNNLVEKAVKLLVPLPLVLGVVILAPTFFSPQIYQPEHALFFLASLVLGAVLSFLFDMNLGVLAFWLEDVFQLRGYKLLLEQFTSGIVIPFAFLPPLAFTIFSFLPFRYIYSLPLELLLGRIEGAQRFSVIGIQALWIVGLALTLRLLWRKGLQRYAVPGQ